MKRAFGSFVIKFSIQYKVISCDVPQVHINKHFELIIVIIFLSIILNVSEKLPVNHIHLT